MEQRSVTHQELKDLLLGGKHVVIALVDKDLHNLGLPLWFGPRAQTQQAGFKGAFFCEAESAHPILAWCGLRNDELACVISLSATRETLAFEIRL